MKKGVKIGVGVIILIVIAFLIGPKVPSPDINTDLPEVTSDLIELEKLIIEDTSRNSVKPGNESRLIWANDSLKQKTEYVLIYLHGFSASPEEGASVHTEFAKHYGMNLYIPRLYEHGLISDKPMMNFTGEGFMNSAKEAVAIAKQLGEKVVIMACSTGATAALYIASGNPDIAGLILYSPNIDLYDKTSDVMTLPWGVQLAELVVGSDMYSWEADSIRQQYWYTNYVVSAIAEMKVMLQATMTPEVFQKVNQPLFMGYYYKNEEEQDKTVSVKQMKEMFESVSTPDNLKRSAAFTTVGTHALMNKYASKDYKAVMKESFRFAEEILKLNPLK